MGQVLPSQESMQSLWKTCPHASSSCSCCDSAKSSRQMAHDSAWYCEAFACARSCSIWLSFRLQASYRRLFRLSLHLQPQRRPNTSTKCHGTIPKNRCHGAGPNDSPLRIRATSEMHCSTASEYCEPFNKGFILSKTACNSSSGRCSRAPLPVAMNIFRSRTANTSTIPLLQAALPTPHLSITSLANFCVTSSVPPPRIFPTITIAIS
mmetsp:Transcript_128879/g.223523  ORF Transcript_128879/g.223523 Transcript_128879/m.223523 type:complete len:208 (+) Transcript_128879:485-1108(+)